MRKNNSSHSAQKGFTLIELLVVIAIIGILATIVLTSLGSARSKANDTKVQGQLSGMRAQAEIYYSTYGSYSSPGMTLAACPATAGSGGGTYGTDTIFATTAANNGLFSLLSGWPSGYYADCAALPATGGASAWMVAATNGTAWDTGATEAWCVDSTGASKYYTSTSTPALSTIASLGSTSVACP